MISISPAVLKDIIFKVNCSNYETKIITGLKKIINTPENATAGCFGLFIESQCLIFPLECIGGCAITETCFREVFLSVVENDSACDHHEKDL